MKRHSLKDWFIATRPWSFPASAMPVAVSMAFLWWQQGNINVWAGLLALVNIVIFHAAGNTWSDYHDYNKGVDTADTFGAKTITTGQFTPKEIQKFALTLLVIACTIGVVLMLITGWQLIYAGLAGIAFTLLYPMLKFHAMGDYLIFFCYGVVPTIGTAYVCTGVYDPQMWIIALPVGLITVAILHSNNTRDVITDANAGITTLAMHVGRHWSQAFYLIEILLPYVLLVIFAIAGKMPWLVLLTLLSLPIAIGNSRMMLSVEKSGLTAISGLDEMTAKLQLTFSALFTLSLVLAALFL